MDSTNSTPSTSSKPTPASPGPFAYQTRLLARTTSRGHGSSLSRSNSQSGMGILTNPTGNVASPASVRRYAPSHRTVQSLDGVKGTWETRSKETAEDVSLSMTPSRDVLRSATPPRGYSQTFASALSLQDDRPPTPPPKSPDVFNERGPPLKRRTLPAPINMSAYMSAVSNANDRSQAGPPVLSPLSKSSQPAVDVQHSTAASVTNRFSVPSTVDELSPARLRRYSLVDPPVHSSPQVPSTTPEVTTVSLSPNVPTSPAARPLRRPNSVHGQPAVSTSFRQHDNPGSFSSPSPPLETEVPRFPLLSQSRRPWSTQGQPDVISPLTDRTSSNGAYIQDVRSSFENLTSPISANLSSKPQTPTSTVSPSSASNSVMSPPPFRSSYMANKKGSYGDDLIVGRRLGRHLPRIASGDGDDEPTADKKENDASGRKDAREQRAREWEKNFEATPPTPQKLQFTPTNELPPREPRQKTPKVDTPFTADTLYKADRRPTSVTSQKREPLAAIDGFRRRDALPNLETLHKRESVILSTPQRREFPNTPGTPHRREYVATPESPRKTESPTKSEFGQSTGDEESVAGIPNRRRLRAPSLPTSPVQVPRYGPTWADKQRHLLHAYEYLCHVGEAQQWIEGCLREELGFGVVEMEEGLRNGVVLAKLVRSFQGGGAVRKIYEAPKLDFRHSDNINYFFIFVRDVGLPECFIFELTDLYEKKNIPKVIYCIHALSHLLARRGRAERIGNLVGRLEFSDDQLQQTQKGLKDSGVAMPNFGNVGRELAKEINEEPEVEIETEEDRRDRCLLECEDSVIGFQAVARGFLARRAQSALHSKIQLAGRRFPKLQAHCRAALVRQGIRAQRKTTTRLTPWAVSIQAHARGVLARRRWQSFLRRVKASSRIVVKIQAQARGVLQRRRFSRLKTALKTSSRAVTKLQSIARARITRNSHHQLTKTFARPAIQFSVVSFQAHARGALVRKRASRFSSQIQSLESSFVALQARCRGVIMRRRMRTQMAKLEDVTHVVIRIQATVRTYLARKRLLILIRGLRRATPVVVGFQALARAKMARQLHVNLNKALAEVKTVTAVGSLQTLARARLARRKHQELTRKLEFAAPDVVGFQSVARGVLIRQDYYAWRDHLRRSHPVATILQAMLRGALQRRAFRVKMDYFRANLNKVVKIQSLFRAKETREQYRQLTLGKNVTVGTIKNFVHLLDDSEADFQEEIKVERLRKKVVEHIRENQALESDLSDLDVKIALVIENVKTFEDVVKTRKGADSAQAHAARISLLAAHGDPFSGPKTVDQKARRKLERYQQLFYLLQTQGEYLTRLFIRLSQDSSQEKDMRFTERVVLTLFGYGQDRREDYLLLKLFQLAIRDEIEGASSFEDIVHGYPMYINIAVHYVRPKHVTYARETFQNIIHDLIGADDLNLEADPTVIHRAIIEIDEMRSGLATSQPKNVPFHEALKDPRTRPTYIRHLQVLQWWTEAFMTAIFQSTRKMPYNMRFFVKETLDALRAKFPDAPDESYVACLGRLVFFRYLNPAIVTPETFDIVPKTVNVVARKNLAQVSKVLSQIVSGVTFPEESLIYVPINDFVRKAIGQMSAWILDLANVAEAELQYHAHEFLDATVQPKPIYISPNEIYTIHSLLAQHQEFLAPDRGDTLRVILHELDGVPNLGSEELKDARDRTITLELTNRFADVQDPHADEKTLWVQAKRGVLAILRVQPAQDLLEALLRKPTEEDELLWEEILEAEMEAETRPMSRRQPSTTAAESAYRLEDIRSLRFAAVKVSALEDVLELERRGKLNRDDKFQGILNAIAGDVRSKHRKRIQRQQEMASMNDALRQLAERKKYFEEKIDSYHSYVQSSMNTMQRGKGKKRFVMPFTKQYFHLRDLQKSGETPQFGSFIYSAKYLYEKGILLSIDQYSPRQFDKMQLTMSSDAAGIFTLVLESTLLGPIARLASEDVKMEDLLQAKYEKRQSLALLEGKVKVNFELFLYQINKKFYV